MKYDMNKELGALAQIDPVRYFLENPDERKVYEHVIINTKFFRSPEEFLSNV